MGGARLGPGVGAALTGSGGGWCRAKTQGTVGGGTRL